MVSWKCSNCGYTLEADVPTEQCKMKLSRVISWKKKKF